MKKLIPILFLLLATVSQAQISPSGMKYQAIARDAQGKILANQPIAIQIALMANEVPDKSDYVEEHRVITNQFGLFTLTIGKGDVQQGIFKDIPWSSQQILLELAIDDQGNNDFQVVHTGHLLAVPYAFHANSANVADEVKAHQKESELYWRLEGNKKINPEFNFFGTTDKQDIIVKTDSKERMRVTADGTVQITDAYIFLLNAKQANISDDLNVAQNTTIGLRLDVGDATTLGSTLDVTGATTLNNTLYVKGASALDNTLDVTGASTLNNTLYVKGASTLDNTLDITGASTLNNTLYVKGASTLDNTLGVAGATEIDNTLDVSGATEIDNTLDVSGATKLDQSLTVDGKTTLNEELEVTKSAAEFIAYFENTNGGDGDGIQIKLGRTHPAWDGGAYLNIPDPAVEIWGNRIDIIKSWIEGDIDANLVLSSIAELIPSAFWVGSACNITEAVSGPINDVLGLPYEIGEITAIPGIPNDFCPDFLPGISIPNINVLSVNNSLSSENQFISFVDKDNRELGSIKANSVSDWYDNYFNGLYVVNFIGSVIGIDVLGLALAASMEFSNITDSYNSLGVEYASGNGDYAEWLERRDQDELITAGDIVGVIGGQISKNIAGAEQVMAVSHKPIVLGNMPPTDHAHLGNKVAFMGQVPVKIIGAVNTGDYIVAKGAVPGYGQAVAPENMTPEDFKYVVGRAWESNAHDGPKQINTVIGLHNGDYLKILQDQQQQILDSAKKLETLESKVNNLSQLVESALTN